jgi:hypothetical protein
LPTTIRFTSFPRTAPPPDFVREVVAVFQRHERDVSTTALPKGLTSNEVLIQLAVDLKAVGFDVEGGRQKADKIERPVFYGENGIPALNYQIDAYHKEWRCGLEIEAGRGWMGNAIYRNLVQAMVMVQVDHLILAVANKYKYLSGGRAVSSGDYDNTIAVADALYGHTRIEMPYRLTVVGY